MCFHSNNDAGRFQRSQHPAIALFGVLLAAAIGFASPVLAVPGAALTCPTGGGVVHVGAGQTFATLGAAVAAASNGDTICVAAGLYLNDFVTTDKDLTIRGVGGLAHFEATGEIPNRKAIIVTSGNLTLEAMEFSGARVSANDGGNGAGIRYEGGDLTIRQSYFHDNQEGILGEAGSGNVVVEDSKFVDNGQSFPPPDQTDLGQVHGIYLSNLASLTIDNSYFDSTHIGHHIKADSVAMVTVRNSTLEDGLGSSATLPSFSVDLPGEGNASIENNTIIQRGGAPNGTIIHYSADQAPASGPPADSALAIDQNTVLNERHPGTLLLNQTPVVATITGNTLVGVDTIASGAATVSGNLTSGLLSHNFMGPLLSVSGADGEGQIAEFDGTGAATGGLDQPSGIVGNTGIAAVGQNVFVANRYQGVGIVDPLTGSSTLYRGPQGIEGLGVFGDMLIGGVFDNDSIVQFSIDTTGAPHAVEMVTITLHVPDDRRLGITGLDSNDSTILYVGSYLDGNVYAFDPDGNFLSEIMTGLGADVLSGLAYDRGNETLWLATGYGDNTVYQYSLTGQQIESFAAPIADIGGLDVFASVVSPPGPPSPVSAPSSGVIFGLGLATLLLALRRRGGADRRMRPVKPRYFTQSNSAIVAT